MSQISHQFSTSFIILAIVILGIPILVSLFSRKGSDSVLRAMGLTLVICVGIVFLVRGFRSSNISEVQEARKNVTTVTQSTDDVQQPNDSYFPGSRSGVHTNVSVTIKQTPEDTSDSDQVLTAELPESTVNNAKPGDNAMWLPLSSAAISDLLSPEGADALAKLNADLPPELRQAYAVIPLPAAAPNLTPPLLEKALSVPEVRDVLTSNGVQEAVSGFVDLAVAYQTRLAEDGTKKIVMGVQPTAAEADEYIPATWIANPGVGRVVVESEFAISSEPATKVLRPAIVKALKEQVSKLSKKQFRSDGEWEKLVDISVSDEALMNCIVATSVQQEVIETNGDSHLLQKTYALVEFPESIQTKVLADVRSALKQDRAIALCIVVAALWLGWMLLSVMFRSSQNGSLFRKLTTVPVLSLLVLPCILVAIFMTTAIIEGKTFSLSWNGERVTCAIDDVE